MRKYILALVLMVILSACTAVDVKDDDVYYSFTDHTGNSVILNEKPQRTAVLLSSFADIWLTAGGEIYATVGESIERGFADADVLLVDSGAGKTIDNELLISYEPDFVICSSDIAAQLDTAELLNSVNIPCAVLRVETFEDYLDVLKIFTDITGEADRYQEYGLDIQNRIDELLGSADNADEKKILFIRSGSKQSSAKAKTAETHFACAMLKELGTYNIAENAPMLLDGLSIEEILIEDPEYIFISTMGDEAAAKEYMDSVLESTEWSSLTAVKEGNYCYLPKELFQYKPNSRWAEAYEYLIDILYKK